MSLDQTKLPHWDLSNVFPGLDSPEFKLALQEVTTQLDELDEYINKHKLNNSAHPPADSGLGSHSNHVAYLVEQLNTVFTSVNTLNNYVSSYTSTDSFNTQAKNLYSQIQAIVVRAREVELFFTSWLRSIENNLTAAIESNPIAAQYNFYLQELAQRSLYLMSPKEESLANELSLSSLRAWKNLQGTITSQLTIEFKIDGEDTFLPLPALQNIRRYNPDSHVRQAAFNAEIQALGSVREPLAACMNGVKGFQNVLDYRRGRKNAIHTSLDEYRIDQDTLEVMLSAMRASFPSFRRYLEHKAKRFNKKALPWWDLFAPVAENNRIYSWGESQDFIIDNFATFSSNLANFAKKAFSQNWIDAEPRRGKRGGAFCMRIPSVEESRILCNFDGSLDQISTIAHELGHAYHIECQRGKKFLQYQTPMTLAETASTFCETIIMEAALEQAESPDEKLSILETLLIGDTQIIVDISSRYLFEKEVFERRKEAELSADELCELMTKAQVATYGDALDPEHLHPYMWSWKPHYFREDIAFYNYPYAFGLLFSAGLYTVYKERGKEFVPQFQSFLSNTGMAKPVELAANFGINIQSIEFWTSSLDVLQNRIERYLAL